MCNHTNGTQITQASENYNYRAYLESLLTYGTDAADSHLRMAYWELDERDLKGGDCSKPAELSDTGFLARWNHVEETGGPHVWLPSCGHMQRSTTSY